MSSPISIDDFGADPTGAQDSTAAIQAAVIAAKKPASAYPLSVDLPTGLSAHVKSHQPTYTKVVASPGGMYVVSDTITLDQSWWGLFDGQGAQFIWNGPASIPMWYLHNVRQLTMRDFKIFAHASRPCLAGFQADRERNGITPTHCHFENIALYGHQGGFLFGWRMAVGAYDGNGDFFSWRDCAVYDYVEAAWSIEHSQSKAHYFSNCQFNAGTTGKRGVTLHHPEYFPNGNGSFYWVGGGGGGNKVADFAINGPLENILIDGGKFEQSARLLTTAFYEVIAGLVGAVPDPPSLTMSTPGGSAYVLGATPGLVPHPGFTHTYAASKDTYDLLNANGTITHYERPLGAGLSNPPGAGTFLQCVMTNDTGITTVKALGGRHHMPSTGISPVTIKNVGWSSNKEPWDGQFIKWMQKGPLSLIGNRFYVKTTYGNIGVYGAKDPTKAAGKVLLIGNAWRTDLPGPWPEIADRIKVDQGDGGLGVPGSTAGQLRVVAMGEAISASMDGADIPRPTMEVLP
jgi:hypothetical protein